MERKGNNLIVYITCHCTCSLFSPFFSYTTEFEDSFPSPSPSAQESFPIPICGDETKHFLLSMPSWFVVGRLLYAQLVRCFSLKHIYKCTKVREGNQSIFYALDLAIFKCLYTCFYTHTHSPPHRVKRW